MRAGNTCNYSPCLSSVDLRLQQQEEDKTRSEERTISQKRIDPTVEIPDRNERNPLGVVFENQKEEMSR
ncbi:hypothetical protein V6N11_078225 [Hibiscus sabdariffa]|uniref:Uncharacterized protein n=1 Tax=Hibiscus sabdariffa TaxID=183260 RepID=A0ABR2TFV6_9ROSI